MTNPEIIAIGIFVIALYFLGMKIYTLIVKDWAYGQRFQVEVRRRRVNRDKARLLLLTPIWPLVPPLLLLRWVVGGLLSLGGTTRTLLREAFEKVEP